MKVTFALSVLAFAAQMLVLSATPSNIDATANDAKLSEDSKQINFPNPFDLIPNPADFIPTNGVGSPFIPNPFDVFVIPTGRPEPASTGLDACGNVVLRNTLGCSCFFTFQVGMPPEFPPIFPLTRDFCDTFFGPLETGARFCTGLTNNINMIAGQGPLMIPVGLFNCVNALNPLLLPTAI